MATRFQAFARRPGIRQRQPPTAYPSAPSSGRSYSGIQYTIHCEQCACSDGAWKLRKSEMRDCLLPRARWLAVSTYYITYSIGGSVSDSNQPSRFWTPAVQVPGSGVPAFGALDLLKGPVRCTVQYGIAYPETRPTGCTVCTVRFPRIALDVCAVFSISSRRPTRPCVVLKMADISSRTSAPSPGPSARSSTFPWLAARLAVAHDGESDCARAVRRTYRTVLARQKPRAGGLNRADRRLKPFYFNTPNSCGG